MSHTLTELTWAGHAPLPLLFVLHVLPLIGSLVVWSAQDKAWGVWAGRWITLLVCCFAIAVLRAIDPLSPALQLVEHGALGWHVGVDGISGIFVLLTTLLAVLLSIYGMARGMISRGRMLAVLLATEGCLLGMLLHLNLLWFAVTSAGQLALVAYLLGRWASTHEERLAFVRFAQYQAFGWFLFAGGVLLLGWHHADTHAGLWSFDLFELAKNPPPGKLQAAAFYLLFYGLAVRTPLFPLHGWLPNMARFGLVAVGPVLMLGVKVGIYGMVRFLLPLTPDAVVRWQTYVMAFAMTGIFYTAILACLQTNLRRLMAFAVVSHTSLLVIGLFTLHPAGLQGAVLAAVNFGLAATTMMFMVGFVYRRTRTTDLDKLGGLFDRLPFIGVTFLIGGLAVVGMPGTPGFDAAHLILEAAIESFGALPTVAAALGNVIAAGFLLWAFQRAFLSPPPDHAPEIEPVHGVEFVVGGVVVAVLLIAGFFPEPWLHLTDVAAQTIAGAFHHE